MKFVTQNKEKAALAGAAHKNDLQKKVYQNFECSQGAFDRSALPEPSAVLRKLDITMPVRVNYAGYWALRCPFHKGGKEQRASLNMHTVSGHYKCHACGAYGGDILAFYMAVTGKKFEDGARDLGAWKAGS